MGPPSRTRTKTLSFKASDLLKDDEVKSKLRQTNYKVEYQKCLDAVDTVNRYSQSRFTLYTIPTVLAGDPHFELHECIDYLKAELKKAEFYVKLMLPGNQLFISWRPEHIKIVREKEQRREKRRLEKKEMEDKAKPNISSAGMETQMKGNELVIEIEKGRDKPGRKAEAQSNHIDYHPASALSNLSLRSSLMRDNPKYAHLPSIKRLKSKGKSGARR